jgi:PAS domain-containing protein
LNDDKLEPGGPERAKDLEDLFENAPCGYLSAQPDGRVLKANLTFVEWVGYDLSYLIGRRNRPARQRVQFRDLLNIAGKTYSETQFAPLLRR